jgi:glycosyltransferase involved in cell wall biosynthesis
VVAIAGQAPGERALRLAALLTGAPLNPRTQSGVALHFVDALARRHEIVERVDASMSPLQRAVAAALSWRRDRRAWQRAMHQSPLATRFRTRNSRRALRRVEGAFDLVVQVRGLYAPFDAPYVSYLDDTMHTLVTNWPDHAPWSERQLRRAYAAEQASYAGARHVFVTGKLVAESLVSFYGLPHDRVSVVGGGSNFPVVAEDAVRPKPPRVLFVGHDFVRKGGPWLLDAFEIVRRSHREAELLIAGPPLSIARPGVRSLGWIADRAALSRLFASARVFCFPSVFEPYGMALLEAMAHGVACIATDVGAVREIVEDGKTGIVVPPRDETALAEALTFLLADDGARADEMGRAARRVVATRFTWDHVVERMTPALEAASS